MPLSLNGWKGLSMAVFAVISVVGAAVAVAVKEKARQLHVTCGVLFSAGVLLAGGFVHLLADSNEQFAGPDVDFPWAFAIAGFTVACLSCVEIVTDRGIDNCIRKAGNNASAAAAESADEVEDEPLVETRPATFLIEQEHNHSHVRPTNSFSAVILNVALSIHSIIEGLGIGAAADLSDLTATFVAVAVHKGFVAFALAEGMVSSGYWNDRSRRKYFYLSIGTFVSVTLLGIAIGWAASGGGEENVATAVLAGMTSGSFIYVAVLEIIPEEAKKIKSERLALLPVIFSFMAGYCLMTLLAVWV